MSNPSNAQTMGYLFLVGMLWPIFALVYGFVFYLVHLVVGVPHDQTDCWCVMTSFVLATVTALVMPSPILRDK